MKKLTAILFPTTGTMKPVVVVLFFVALQANAQKSQSTTVTKTPTVTIDRIIKFDEENTPLDTVYLMMARDARYSSIVELIGIKHGSADEIVGLLNKCLRSIEEEPDGTTLQFEGNTLSITKAALGKVVMLHGIEDDRDGYVFLHKALISKITQKFKEHLAKGS